MGLLSWAGLRHLACNYSFNDLVQITKGLELAEKATEGESAWWFNCNKLNDIKYCNKTLKEALVKKDKKISYNNLGSVLKAGEWWITARIIGLEVELQNGDIFVDGQIFGSNGINTLLIFIAAGIIISLVIWIKLHKVKSSTRKKSKSLITDRLKTSDKSGVKASAQWSHKSTLRKAGLCAKPDKWSEPRVYVGQHHKRFMSIDREQRTLILGRPGTGKTVLLVQQALYWLRAGGDLVLGDTKPELYGMLKPALDKLGVKTIVLAPFNKKGDRYGFWKDLGETETERASGLEILATGFVPPVSGDNQYFADLAQKFVYCQLAYLREKKAPLSELMKVGKIIEETAPKNDIAGHYLRVMRQANDSTIRDRAYLLRDLKLSMRTWGSVSGNVANALEWLVHPAAKDFVCQDKISLREALLGNQQCCIVIMHPDKDWDSKGESSPGTKDRFYSTLVGYTLHVIKNCGKRRPREIMLLLDELGNFPAVPALTQFLNICRDRKITACLATQEADDLDNKYGERLKTTASCLLSYAVDGEISKKYVSDKLGEIEIEEQDKSSSGFLEKGKNVSIKTEKRHLLEQYEMGDLEPGELVFYFQGMRSIGSAKKWWLDKELNQWLQSVKDDDELAYPPTRGPAQSPGSRPRSGQRQAA